ncbi:MAG: MBL fold metallo-hydrolase [Pseudomonadota bacterium]
MSDPFNRDTNVEYGVPVHLTPQVRRLTVRNPSPMTFTGTQTYIVGEGQVAVIDPGPMMAAQTEAILAALAPGETIGAILLTHTHVDHSPGATALKAATGAPTYAFGPHGAGESPMMAALGASGAEFGGGEGADHDFIPDEVLPDNSVVEVGGATITALHTPGHLSNHLCYALDDGTVFSGDLVMGWATTMVSPPDGDMAAFMGSLARMGARGDRIYLPGHGHAVTDPQAMIAHQTAHRLGRETQIIEALEAMGEATPAALTAAIYIDVDPALHGAAARNVFAHLLGLISTGRAEADGQITPSARFRVLSHS